MTTSRKVHVLARVANDFFAYGECGSYSSRHMAVSSAVFAYTPPAVRCKRCEAGNGYRNETYSRYMRLDDPETRATCVEIGLHKLAASCCAYYEDLEPFLAPIVTSTPHRIV